MAHNLPNSEKITHDSLAVKNLNFGSCTIRLRHLTTKVNYVTEFSDPCEMMKLIGNKDMITESIPGCMFIDYTHMKIVLANSNSMNMIFANRSF